MGGEREGVEPKHATSLPSNSDDTLLLTFRIIVTLKNVSFILLPTFHASFTGSVINLLYSTAHHLRFTSSFVLRD